MKQSETQADEWELERRAVVYYPYRDRILDVRERLKDVDTGTRRYRFVDESNTHEYYWRAEVVQNEQLNHIVTLDEGYGKARNHELVKPYR